MLAFASLFIKASPMALGVGMEFFFASLLLLCPETCWAEKVWKLCKLFDWHCPSLRHADNTSLFEEGGICMSLTRKSPFDYKPLHVFYSSEPLHLQWLWVWECSEVVFCSLLIPALMCLGSCWDGLVLINI